MIVESTRQDQIKNIIIRVANEKKLAIPEYINKAVSRYINDERDLSIIEQELRNLAEEIKSNGKFPLEDSTKNVNSSFQNNVIVPNNDEQSKTVYIANSANSSDNRSQFATTTSVNLQSSSQDDLSEMLAEETSSQERSKKTSYSQEKGKTYVKKISTDNNGHASFLNLCFIFSTVAILGMMISSLLIYIQKIFN